MPFSTFLTFLELHLMSFSHNEVMDLSKLGVFADKKKRSYVANLIMMLLVKGHKTL